MFSTETLFILGAGASKPYGYPTGSELIEQIISNMEDEVLIPIEVYSDFDLISFDKIQEILEKIALENLEPGQIIHNNRRFDIFLNGVTYYFYTEKIGKIDRFNELKFKLNSSSPASIDKFLNENKSLRDVGKIMIIYSILKQENKESFLLRKNEDHWYPYLLDDMVNGCTEFPIKIMENKLKIINFNYDVSCKFYISSRMKEKEIFSEKNGDFPISENFSRQLEINHVYGQVRKDDIINEYGSFFYLNSISSDFRISSKLFFNLKRFFVSLRQFENIKTMYCERKENYYFDTLKWANKIVIIGFGFDPDNLKVLGFNDALKDRLFFLRKEICYLNYNGEKKSLDREFQKLRKMSGNGVEIISSHAKEIKNAYLNDFKKYFPE